MLPQKPNYLSNKTPLNYAFSADTEKPVLNGHPRDSL